MWTLSHIPFWWNLISLLPSTLSLPFVTSWLKNTTPGIIVHLVMNGLDFVVILLGILGVGARGGMTCRPRGRWPCLRPKAGRQLRNSDLTGNLAVEIRMQRDEIMTLCDREVLPAASCLFGAREGGFELVPGFEGCANLVYQYERDGQPLILQPGSR